MHVVVAEYMGDAAVVKIYTISDTCMNMIIGRGLILKLD